MTAKRTPKNTHVGSTLDSLFEELGEKDDVGLLTQKKVLAAKVARAVVQGGMPSADR